MIKEKTKVFKKKVLYQLNSPSRIENESSKEKTLKYSKSVENFQMLPTELEQQQKVLVKNEEEDFWANRTQIQAKNQPRLEETVDFLREEVQTYKKRITLLENPTNILTYKLGEQQTLFEQEMALKIKERGIEIEELKGRLKYFENTTQELKNRLSN